MFGAGGGGCQEQLASFVEVNCHIFNKSYEVLLDFLKSPRIFFPRFNPGKKFVDFLNFDTIPPSPPFTMLMIRLKPMQIGITCNNIVWGGGGGGGCQEQLGSFVEVNCHIFNKSYEVLLDVLKSPRIFFPRL